MSLCHHNSNRFKKKRTSCTINSTKIILFSSFKNVLTELNFEECFCKLMLNAPNLFFLLTEISITFSRRVFYSGLQKRSDVSCCNSTLIFIQYTT